MSLSNHFYLSSTIEGTVSSKTFNEEYLPAIVEHIEDFLKGSGFVFNRLEVITTDDE